MFKEIYSLLPVHYKKKLIFAVLIILGRTILELAGIAIILPIFYSFLNPDAINSEYLKKFVSIFGNDTSKALIIFYAMAIALLAIKSCLQIWLSKVQNRFLLNLYKYFSTRLLKIYYERGYQAIKEFPASDYAYKINAVCLVFVNGILYPFFDIIASSMIVLVILTFFLIKSPIICLAIILCAIPTILLYVLSIKKRIIKYGRMENEARREQFNTIINTFRGYPEMIVNGVFPVMQQKFKDGLETISEAHIKYGIYKLLPSYIIELSIVICAGMLVIVQMHQILNIPQIIALFGIAALKVLPSIKSIISSWSSIKNCNYSIETIQEALQNPQPAVFYIKKEDSQQELLPANFKFENLTLKDIDFNFPSRQIFNKFNLTLNKGEKLGIKGVSGSGKSTLFNIMLGLYPVDKGEVLINRKPLDQNTEQWHNACGYVPQNVFIMNASIAENIAIGTDFKVKRKQNITLKEVLTENNERDVIFDINPQIKARIEKALELAQLKEHIDTLPHGIFTVIGDDGSKLSGGQKQRLGIARALFKEPQLLFFDEATSALNSEMEIEITNAIKNISLQNKSITIVIIAHRHSSLEICDRIIDI